MHFFAAASIASLLLGLSPANAGAPSPYRDLGVGSPRLSELALVPPPLALTEGSLTSELRSSLWRRGELSLAGLSSTNHLTLLVTRGPRHTAPEIALSPAIEALIHEVGRTCAKVVQTLGQPHGRRSDGDLFWHLEGRQMPWTLSAVQLTCAGDEVASVRLGWVRNQDLRELVAASRRLRAPAADAQHWPFGVVAGMGVGTLLQRWGPATSAYCVDAPQPDCFLFWNPGVGLTVDDKGAVSRLSIQQPLDFGAPSPEAFKPFFFDEADRSYLAGSAPAAWGEATDTWVGGERLTWHHLSRGYEVFVRRNIPWSSRPSLLSFSSPPPAAAPSPDRTADGGVVATKARRPPKPFFQVPPEGAIEFGLKARTAARQRGLRGPAIDLLGAPTASFVAAFGEPEVDVEVDHLTLRWRGQRGDTLVVVFGGEPLRAVFLMYDPNPTTEEQEGDE